MHDRGELKWVEIGGYKMFLIALLIVEILGVASAGQISENAGNMCIFTCGEASRSMDDIRPCVIK